MYILWSIYFINFMKIIVYSLLNLSLMKREIFLNKYLNMFQQVDKTKDK